MAVHRYAGQIATYSVHEAATSENVPMKRASDKILSDFQSLVASLEGLVAEAADRAGDHLESAAGGMREKLKEARERLCDLEQSVRGVVRPPRKDTEELLEGIPWVSLAVVAGVSFLCGVMVAHRGRASDGRGDARGGNPSNEQGGSSPQRD